MNLVEAYNLFMHRLNPHLRQLAGKMVTSGNLEELIELVKIAMVYGEDKGGSSQMKTETNKNDRVEKKAAKGVRANGSLVADQRERSKSFQGTPSKRSLLVQQCW